MPPTQTTIELDAHLTWRGDWRVEDRVVSVEVTASDPSAASPAAISWAEGRLRDLALLDERARAIIVRDADEARTETCDYLYSLSGIAASQLRAMFGRGQWEVKFVEYGRALRLMHVRIALDARESILDYGLAECAWEDRLRITLAQDDEGATVARTWGGRAGTHPVGVIPPFIYLLFEDDLDNHTLVRAVASLGVPGLGVHTIERNFGGSRFTTEMCLEGCVDALAVARMLRDTLSRAVALSDEFWNNYGWLVLDPLSGECLVEFDERSPEVPPGGWPFRLDMWEGRPEGATGSYPSGWAPTAIQQDAGEPPNYTSLVLPRDIPVAAIETAVLAAGGKLLWTSQWDHCCVDVTFAGALSQLGCRELARALADSLGRDVLAGLRFYDGGSWVRFQPRGDEHLVHFSDGFHDLKVGEVLDPATLEDAQPYPPRPKRLDGAGQRDAAAWVPPVYTTLMVPDDLPFETIDAALASLAVPTTTLCRSSGPWDHRQITLRSEADQLTVARAAAAALQRRVVVGLTLRGAPGWVIIDLGDREWVGDRAHWSMEPFEFLRPFEEDDYVR